MSPNSETPEQVDLASVNGSLLRTVIAGRGERAFTFIVRTDILTKTSKFLKAACKEEWSKGSRVMALPEVNPALFGSYIRWCCGGRGDWAHSVPSPTHYEDPEFPKVSVPGCPSGFDDKQQTLLAFYMLADFLIDASFANTIMDEVKDYAFWGSNFGSIPAAIEFASWAYANVPRSGRFHVFVCRDLYHLLDYYGKRPGMKSWITKLPREILEDITAHLFERDDYLNEYCYGFPEKIKPDEIEDEFYEKCAYHEHGEGILECPP